MKSIPLAHVLVALSLVALSAALHAEETPELLRDIPAPHALRDLPYASRSRPADLDVAVLEKLNGAGPHRLGLSLFDDRRYTVAVRRMAHTGGTHAVFVGEVEDLKPSIVTIAVVDGVASIELSVPNGKLCRVAWQPGGIYQVSELDPDKLGGCGNTDDEHEPEPPVTVPPSLAHAPEAGAAYVDVLAMYTPEAGSAAGGRSAMVSAILNRWSYAQQAHLNSGSTLQLRLTDIVEFTGYSESGKKLDNMLSDINSDSTVAALRDANGADLVHLFVSTQGTTDNASAVGLASRPGTRAVTKWDAADSVFAHETGHNLGCRHQYTNDSAGTFEHAYQITYSFDGIFTYIGRTVMWSSTGSAMPVFSDPNNFTRFHDQFWGDSPLLALGDANANNSRFIRENRMTAVGRKQPMFWLMPLSVFDGDATMVAPAHSLQEVIGSWRSATGASSGLSPIKLAAGNYAQPIRITAPVRLEKWLGAGAARIGN